MRMKKAISILLAALMVFSVMPITAFAQESEISSISFTPAQDKVVYEYTNGYVVDDQTYGEWWYYYVPTFEEGDRLTINFTEGDSEVYTYSTSEEHNYGAFVDNEGNEIDPEYNVRTQYTFEQSYENQYTYGQYRYVIAVYDQVAEQDVTLDQYFTFAKNPVNSIELNFAPIVLTEGKNCYTAYDNEGDPYVAYRYNYMVAGNQIILHTDNDDIVYTYGYYDDNYGYQSLGLLDSEGNPVDETMFHYRDSQDTDHWIGGNTYKVAFTYLDHYTTSFEVTVQKPPYAVEVEGYQESSAMENTGGYVDSDTGNYYYVTPSLCYPGVTLTVRYEDRDDVTYTVESRYNEQYGYTYYVFVDGDGNDMTENVYTVDDQRTNPWGIGEHTYHFEVFGVATQDFTFTVKEAPKDMIIEGFDGGSAFENDGGYSTYDSDNQPYYYYWLPSVCQEGVTVTLVYDNSEDVTYHYELRHNNEENYDYSTLVDDEGNEIPTMPRTESNQQSTHFTVGENTYYVVLGDIRKEYTFTVKEAPYDIEIEGFRGDDSAIEHTGGSWSHNYDTDEDFYEYWLPSLYDEGVTITLKYHNSPDVVYHTEEVYNEEEDWTHWEFFDEDGNPADINIYMESKQYETPWTVGENTFYVVCGGVQKPYTFTVLPGPERIEFEYADNYPTTFMEYSNGYYEEESGVFIYNLPYPVEAGNKITFYYPDEYEMEPAVYTCIEFQHGEDPEDTYWAFADSEGNELEGWIYMDLDQTETPLTVGENHVKICIDDYEIDVVFTILGGPTSVDFLPAQSTEIYENVGGCWEDDGQGGQYFCYYYNDTLLYYEGNQLVLHFDDREDVTYEARAIDHGDWSDIQYVNINDENDSFLPWEIKFSDDQAENHWGIGIHEVEVEYAGCTATAEVEIIPSPVESIEFAYANGVPAIAVGEHMTERWYDPTQEPAIVYDLSYAICQPGNTLTVTYNDGTPKAVYTCSADPESAERYWFFDQNGEPLDMEFMDCIDDQVEAPWGEGLHNFSICYLGAYAEADVIIGEAEPPEPFDLYANAYNQSSHQYIEGEDIVLRPGEKIFIYFITDPDNIEHGYSPFVGFSDGYDEGTLTTKGFTVVTGTGEELGYELPMEDMFGLEISAEGLLGGTEGTLNYFVYELPEGWTWDDFDEFDFATTPHALEHSIKVRVEFKNGWNQVGDNWYYVENGEAVKGWKQIRGSWYYFDDKGVMQTGFVEIKGATYYLDESGAMKTGLFKLTFEDDYYNWYYANSSGALQSGWQTVDGKTYYFFPGEFFMVFGGFNEIDGKTYYLEETGAAKGWKQIDGAWYYFDTDCSMVTGWKKVSNKWYYFDDKGVMQTGFVVVNGKTYYFNASGAMLTGWQKLDNKWYYFASSGAMATGWQTISNVKYYFDASGVMQTGWQEIGGKKYYFASSGAMQKGIVKIGGKSYFFDTNGAQQKGWQKVSGKWYYFDTETNVMVTGWKQIGGKWYYFNTDGTMKTGWLKSGGKWYYFNSGGAMLTGWQKISNKWYYFEASGAMRTANLTYKGKVYKFNSSGACLNP